MNTAEHALALLDEEELVAFLCRLVQTPSVYVPGLPGASEEACARLVYEQLEAWGWRPLWQEVSPGRPNVVAELRGELGERISPLLLMEGHTDVVTPGDLAAWTRDPFGAEIVGRRLYGRGAADMKGGLAAMLFAARALQCAGAPFRGTLRLLVPCDEEGMMTGVKALAAGGHATGAAGAIVCEPEEREVCLAQKGALRLRLVSYGRIAHGAMPDTGVNALSGLVRALARVLELETELRATYGEHPLLGTVHISPTVARAPLAPDPTQLNCLPDHADAFLDIRTIPALRHPVLLDRLRALLDGVRADYPASRFELEVLDDRPATEIAPDHPLVQAVVAAHQGVYGETARYGGVPGSTDGTILARDTGVPVVVYGPGEKRIPHQPDEWVDLDEVVRAARVYVLAVLAFLNA